MGLHDALDEFITFRELQHASWKMPPNRRYGSGRAAWYIRGRSTDSTVRRRAYWNCRNPPSRSGSERWTASHTRVRDLLPDFRPIDKLRDWLPIRRERCAKCVLRKSIPADDAERRADDAERLRRPIRAAVGAHGPRRFARTYHYLPGVCFESLWALYAAGSLPSLKSKRYSVVRRKLRGRPVQQIAAWLGKLGLEQYAKLFSDNDIDVAVLPHLSDQDLKDLGISLGHRRKIFAAINEGFASVQPLAAADRAEEHFNQETPERRYVTVLFSDLVGSTALSTRLDPEDLRDVIAVYQRCVEETVRRFDGFIAKFLGDGVLVYFGYPEAHEDDPEQAVRAGLELVAAVKGLQTPEPLEARVGIATGLVVVGDMIGSGASQEQAIVGKTPNLAARLQGIAAPSMVVIADSTRKLLGNLFELEDLGGKDLKGIEGPERVWAVLRANLVDSRFDAFHTTGVTELVGRQEELELLLRRWTKAVTGEGQVVLLSGEPGIGKSRLTAALLERLSTEPHTRLRYFCSPQHTDSALYPIITQMERAAGFAHDDTAQAKLEKLDALLSQSFTPPQDRALFAELLSLRSDGLYPKLDLTPQQRRERTFEALTTQIVSLAEQRPVLMTFEDIHWIDPTSLEALGRGIDRIKSVGVLLVITHRAEFEPPWLGRPYVTALSLNRLGEHEMLR